MTLKSVSITNQIEAIAKTVSDTNNNININNNNILLQKMSNEEKDHHILISPSNIQNSTTTVNLSESNPNIFFMMQSPLDIITANNHNLTSSNINQLSSPNHTLKLKLSPSIALSSNAPYNGSVLPSVNHTTITLTSPIHTHSTINTPSKVGRDERRRANHNEG